MRTAGRALPAAHARWPGAVAAACGAGVVVAGLVDAWRPGAMLTATLWEPDTAVPSPLLVVLEVVGLWVVGLAAVIAGMIGLAIAAWTADAAAQRSSVGTPPCRSASKGGYSLARE